MKVRMLKFFLILNLCFSVSLRAEESIKIGGLFSLSGFGAQSGSEELKGVRLAIDEINAVSGISGKKIQLVVEDTHSDLKLTVTALKKLSTIDRVQAVVGPNWAEFFGVAAPVASAEQLPLISASGTGDGVLRKGATAFTLWPRFAFATQALAKYIQAKGYKKVTVLLHENAYYQGVFDSLSSQMHDPKKLFGTPHYFRPDQQDFRSVLSRIRNDGSEAVLALLVENSGLQSFFKQVRELDLKLPLISGTGVVYDEELRKDFSIAEGTVFFNYVVAGGPDFVKKHRERYQSDPGQASAKAYDSVYLIKTAIENCGETRKAIIECLRSANYVGVSGQIRFQEDGGIDAQEPNTRLYVIRDAKIVAYTAE